MTVTDATRHLTTILDEEVTSAEVLRLALDGHLKLSVNFVNHADVKRGKIVPIDEAEREESTLEQQMEFIAAQKGGGIPEGTEGMRLALGRAPRPC